MDAEPISRRALNRALLARQHLLARTTTPIPALVEHLVGLQAQEPNDPYVALFARLKNFDPHALGAMIEAKSLVRLTLHRGTLHLVTARDAHAIRPVVQPATDRILKQYRRGFSEAEVEAVAAAARKLLSKEPLTYAQLGDRLKKIWPRRNATAMARIVQTRLYLIQSPPRGVWGKKGPARHEPLAPTKGHAPLDIEKLILRYLAAFGPASVMDVQAWCGLTKLGPAVESLGGRLVKFRSPAGEVLFDLPSAPRPDPEVPAPPRFLPVYENLVLGFRDRSRVFDPRARFPPLPQNAIVRFALIDGSLGALWKVHAAKGACRLEVRPFVAVAPRERAAIKEEGDRVLEFLHPDARMRSVEFTPRPSA